MKTLVLRRSRVLGLASTLVLSCALAAAPQDLGSAAFAARAVDPEITAADLEACVRYLASDAMRGRATGSEELMEAARGLAGRLAAAGLAPAGDGEGYLQQVPLARVRYTAIPRLTLILADGERREAVWGVDFDFASGLLPEGRFELAVVGSDPSPSLEAAPTRALFVDERGRAGRELASAAGSGWGLVLQRGNSRPGRAAQSEPPRERRDRAGDPSLTVRGPLLELLAGGSVLGVEAAIEGERAVSPAANVVARLDGVGTPERPELAGECIVFSAHYDHLGVDDGAEAGADTIFNGADDDASGCAALLELAEAFAAGPAPARTLVFLFATGEEIGLVGTQHYLEHPPVPLEATVCNLNFEMIGRPDALVGGSGKLWLTGYERSNLGGAFAAAGLELVPDLRPDQDFFRRSDNYAFALRGIVAQTLCSYDLHTDYHRTSDEADKLDFAHMQAAVRAAWIGARALADGDIDPAWLPGGEPGR